jgi:triosephosphate isomerase
MISKKIIVANWKTNPSSLKEALDLLKKIKKEKISLRRSEIVLCPPSVFISELLKKSDFIIGAQEVGEYKEGEHTGKISALMLDSLGVKYVIVGHSEQREQGETNDQISEKVKLVLQNHIHCILCIGENVRDDRGVYLKELAHELESSLKGVKGEIAKKLILAYEPIWAVGKGHKPMDFHELHQMALYLRKILHDVLGKSASAVKILYGGSVDEDTARSLVWQGGVDGLLIGRASLNPYVFAEIVKRVDKE